MNSPLVLNIYGDSGTGKSTLLRLIVEYFRKIDPTFEARLVSAELTDKFAKGINDGYIHLYKFNVEDNEYPFETLKALSRGWWPTQAPTIDNMLKGWTGKLVKPEAETFKKIRALIFEGTATISDYLAGNGSKGSLASRTGRGEKIGPQEESIHFKDGECEIGGNPRTHYNIVQRWVKDCIDNSTNLSAKYGIHAMWSSHEVKAKDDRTGLPIMGPEVFGNAATGAVPRKFANVWRLAAYPEKDVIVRKLYVKDHEDKKAPGTVFLAKISIDAENDSQVKTSYDKGAMAVEEVLKLLP